MISSIANNRNSTLSKQLLRSTILLLISAFASGSAAAVKNAKKNICSTPGCQDAADVLRSNMNEKVEPCNDFYNFACGGFLKSKSIPKDQYETGQLHILQYKVFDQIREALEEKVDPSEPRSFELAKNYYRSCLDESTQPQNLEALLQIIKDVGGWPVLEGSKWQENKFDLFETERKLRKAGFPPNRILRMYAFPNMMNTSESLLYIGSPKSLVKTELLNRGFMNDIVQAYYKFMVDIAVLMGADRELAKIQLRKALDFEKGLIFGIAPETILNVINPQLIESMYDQTDDYPWLEYINDMTEPIVHFERYSIININNEAYINKLMYNLENTPKKTIANYMIWKIIIESINYLPQEFRDRALEFEKIRSESAAPPLRLPRWRECIELLTDKNSGLGVAVSSMYVRKYFRDASRKEVEPLVASVAKAFKETLDETTWMTDTVKATALRKIEYMRKIIAYPNELLNDQTIDDYSRALEISPDNHFQNFLNLKRFHHDHALSAIGKSTDEIVWESFSDNTQVNAYYYSVFNAFVLLAAILQRPIFNPQWPSYATFGSMGFIVGHEIMHAYDAHRIAYSAAGDIAGWMTGSSKSTFLNRSQCFLDQYNSYVDKQTGLKLNGGLTLNENMADNGGLKVAYRAYRDWVKKHGEDPRPKQLQNYTADQLFFMSAVNFLCGKSTNERRIDSLKTDSHTLGDFRVLGMLSNSEEFAQAYKCPVGSTMNPGKRCIIWN